MTARDEICCSLINAFICNLAAEMSCVDDDKKAAGCFCYKESWGSPVTIACHEVRRQHATSAGVNQQGETAARRPPGAGESRASKEGAATEVVGNSSFSSFAQSLVTDSSGHSRRAGRRAGKAGRLLTRIYWILHIELFLTRQEFCS